MKVGRFFLLCFRTLLAPPVEDEAKTHPKHLASRHKVKDVENRSEKGSIELDFFSIGLPAVKGKLHSKIISSDMKEFFSVESDGEGPRSKFEREDGQTEGGKLARASICDVTVPHWCHLAIMARSRD